MFGDGDALPIVPNLQTVGSPRATTPSKQRSVTPVKQPLRSSSAPRNLAVAIKEVNPCSRDKMRPISRRRRRQWENVNMMELRSYMDGPILMNFEGEEEFPDYVGLAPVEWKSSISRLFSSENTDERESFRKCQAIFPPFSDVRTKYAFRKDEWAMTERIWLERVEKRLRVIISKIVIENIAFRKYLQSVEILILYFTETNSAPPKPSIPMDLSTVLEPGQEIRCHGGNLHVPLGNSPFHRLLLHGVCQFYGLHSQSMTLSKRRITVVKTPKNAPSIIEISRNGLSLLRFLVMNQEPISQSSEIVDSARIGVNSCIE